MQVKEPHLDTKTFRLIAELAHRESGLILPEEKHAMIQSRLRNRLRALDIVSFESYCNLVTSENGLPEREQLISALTTNVSHFFREQHHFDLLRNSVIPKLNAKLKNAGKVRIWSAGCSNGQEALSTAIILLENNPSMAESDVRILGTDIDQNVINFARQGLYPERLTSGLPKPVLAKYFDAHETDSDVSYQAKPVLMEMIRYNALNLLAPWPMAGQFDVIFCRNVVIYFDQNTQDQLWPRFCEQLHRGGILLLGHSERIAKPDNYGLTTTGPTTYQKH